VAGIVGDLTSALGQMNSWLAIGIVAALVFGETAIFIGFVLPGEAAVVLGGVLASRGHLQLGLLIPVVVVAAVTGPLVGYEIGRRVGSRLFTARMLARLPGAVEWVRTSLRDRGGTAVFAGRFVAVVRALIPAAAGAARMPFRVFLVSDVAGGVLWGTGYCLLGYLAGSAYAAVERTVGTGLAIAVAVIVLAVAGVLIWRRHRQVWHLLSRRSEEPAPEPTGTEPTGTEPTGTEPTGTEPTGTEPTGTEPTGTEPTGTDHAGD
jgi:membrane protein DedA with SNARE-associated domain